MGLTWRVVCEGRNEQRHKQNFNNFINEKNCEGRNEHRQKENFNYFINEKKNWILTKVKVSVRWSAARKVPGFLPAKIRLLFKKAPLDLVTLTNWLIYHDEQQFRHLTPKVLCVIFLFLSQNYCALLTGPKIILFGTAGLLPLFEYSPSVSLQTLLTPKLPSCSSFCLKRYLQSFICLHLNSKPLAFFLLFISSSSTIY